MPIFSRKPGRRANVCLGVLIVLVLSPATLKAESSDSLDPLKVDPWMGDYEGEYIATGRDPQPAEAKVIAEGTGSYRVMISAQAAEDPFWSPRIEISGKLADGGLELAGDSAGLPWEGHIRDGQLLARVRSRYGGAFSLHHVLKESPTAGLAPPADAIVLLPFKEGEPTDASEWTNSTWKALPDGSLEVGKGDNHTKLEFGDVRLHVEFCIPYAPEGRGQDRGNSGVYLQDRYESQVLDSYGLIPRAGDCGAVYEIAVPPVNACLPPLSWQTYDITFRAPRFGENGSQTEFPWITVVLNGVELHTRQMATHPTVGGAEDFVPKGPIRLQDHGHKVRFRNLWVEELKGLD